MYKLCCGIYEYQFTTWLYSTTHIVNTNNIHFWSLSLTCITFSHIESDVSSLQDFMGGNQSSNVNAPTSPINNNEPAECTSTTPSIMKSNGSSSSSSSTSTTTKNNYRSTTVENSNNIYREKSRLSKKAAPLVDSALLRFLSQQKSQLQQTEMIPTSSSTDNNTLNTTTNSVSSIVIEKNIQDIKENNVEEDEKDELESDEMSDIELDGDIHTPPNMMSSSVSTRRAISVPPVEDTTADCLYWFTQFNAHRVAQKLLALGACEESAMEAGSVVQNYMLTRTTRQRVRKFLRDRDIKWAQGIESTHELSYEVSDVQEEARLRGESYNLDEILSLMVEVGLTGKDIAAILIHTPSISMMKAKRAVESNDQSVGSGGETLEETINRSFFGVLCSTIQLRKYDARKILRSCPGLLTKRGSIAAQEVVSILSSLGVAPTSLCRDKAALPMLLSRSPSSLFRFVAFLSSDYVRMPINSIGPFIRRTECASVLDLVAPLPRYDMKLLDATSYEIDLSEDNVMSKVDRNSLENIITKRYHAMFQTAEFLRKDIGIADLSKTLAAFPQILTMNKDTVIHVVDFFRDELDLCDEDVAKIIESYPTILHTEISQMRSVIDYMRSIEVADDVLGSIFRAFPALLSLNPESSMKDVVKFLEEIGVTNVGRFVT
jgi:mTERF.